MITGLLKKRNRRIVFLTSFLFFILACSNEKSLQGASWSGGSDFMFINETTMEMHYASNISGNTAYIGGFYEILKAETTDIIDRIQVTKIEFNIRTDGVPYCRIWGTVTNSSELSYLLAEHCKPIYSN